MPFTPTPTLGDDVLTDTAGSESVDALAGNDQVTVTAGIDTVNGGADSDRLIIDYSANGSAVANSGGPAVNGSGGFNGSFSNFVDRSVNYTSIEHFTITTGAGGDNITTATGNDNVATGGGNDLVNVGSGTDQADGGAGDDGISADLAVVAGAILWNLQTNSYSGAVGTSFTNFEFFGTVTTGTGNDVLVTRNFAASETINLGDGDDSATVLHGIDTVNGGAGSDRLIIDYSASGSALGNNGGPVVNGSLGGFNGSFSNNSDRSVAYTSIEHFTITTGAGGDNITTATGNDIVTTGGGNDLVNVGSGTDQADGGAGDDGISADLAVVAGAILWNLQANSYSGAVGTSFTNFEFFGTVTTGTGNDVLVTRNIAANETINLGDGDDSAAVLHGIDTVNGGADNDRLIIDYSATGSAVANQGGPAVNVGLGGFNGSFSNSSDRSVNYTSIEHFTITTGAGGDNITTATGDDIVTTGGGNDLVNVGSGTDQADGGSGDDGISADLAVVAGAILWNLQTNNYSGAVGTSFTNFEFFGTVTTGSGNDVIVTRNIFANETINLGDGDDSATVLHGIDIVNGGAGSDRLIIDYSATGSAISNAGGPTVNGSLGGFNGAFTNNVDRSVNYTSIEHFTITGGTASDTITTASGDDEYRQIAQDNPFYLRDTADLGGGIDRISVDARGTNGALSLLELNYNGSGEVALYGNGKLGFTNVERFFMQGGNAADNLRGLDYADRFDGNAGADRLAGRGGDDDLRGGAGADVIDGDGRVMILLAADNQNNAGTGVSDNDFRVTGNYNLSNAAEFDLVVGLENVGTARLRIRATDVEDVTAGFDPEVDEVYVNDVLIGTLAQFADNATGDTILTFDASLLASGVARVRIQNVNVTQDYSFRIDDVELTLEKTGDDMLDGGAGVDQLVGGRGDDIYIVDEERDQVQEQVGLGSDTVLSQARMFTLGANIENLGTALPATPAALTGETQINTDIVAATQHPRSVTVLNDGGYVVTWQDVNNATDARARVFNADGSARSAEFTVNASTAGNQGQFGLASVALANGGFLVAFYDTNSGPNGERIAGRAYDANGVAQGSDYTLTDTAGTFDSFPAMARLNDGRIALISQNGGSQDGNGTFGIRYTLLNADGSVGAGAPTILQTTTAGDQLGPSVAALDDGRLVVIWESGEPGGKVFRGRLIDADGTPSGNDFLISTPGGETPDSGEVRAQVTAINGGGFAVVWGITNEIVGRVFDSSGTAVAPQFTVNQRTDGAQTTVAITRLAEGGFMAAWTSDNGQDGDVHGVVARLFNGDGSARGDDFVVNQVGTRFQLFPELATLQDGRVVAVFSSDIPGSGNDYEGRQIILDTTLDQTLIGNELANVVTAGSGDDVLAGSGGGDTLIGGAGDDIIFGGGFTGSGVNLVVNGSFETQDGVNVTRDFILAGADGTFEGVAYRGVTSLSGWQRGTATPIELNTANGSTIFAPADGTADVNLEYAPGQNQSLFQDIGGLSGGEKYLLSFAANIFASSTTFSATMQLLWNGAVIDTITPQTKTGGTYTYVLEAAATGSGAGGANRLEFREISSADGGGTTIDAISLEALVAAPDMGVGAMGPNLITNGSFEQRDAMISSRDFVLAAPETNYNGGEPIYRISDQLLGWGFSTGTTRVEFNTDNPANARNEFQTSDGLVGLDLESFPGEQSGIFQDVAGLATGERYRITVSIAVPIGPGADSVAVQVIWNGRVVGTVTPTSTRPTDYSFDVFAEASGPGMGGANRIAFQEVGGNDGQGRGVVLDNVRLNLVAAAEADNDLLQGGDGNDTLYGAGGDDVLDGGAGTNALFGGAGNDTYRIDNGTSSAIEDVGAGTDLVEASLSFTLGSNLENLTLTGAANIDGTGNALDNVITGNVGDNQLDGGAGIDMMVGGLGNDSYVIDSLLDVIVEAADEGVDTVHSSFTMALAANFENLVLTGAGNINGTGTSASNSITGNSGNNRIDGGAGDDVLAGGLGNDTYVVDSSGDVVSEGAAAGSDLVEASASFVLGDNIENLTLTGAAISGTGNAIGNRIIGTAGNNMLDGAGGSDTLQGLGGNDSYVVDNVNDRVVETLSLTVGDTNDAGGVDTVFASVSYSIDTASNVRFVENLTLTGAANINATGNALVNAITGNSGNNTLDGGAGVDVLAGGGGNDLYLLDGATETVTEGAGAGTDTVRIAASYTLTANVENLQLQGSANLNGFGNAENNALTGTSGNNRLEGLGGNDVIDGGLGADTMLGGAGDDSYIIENGNDRVFETLTNNAVDTNDAGGIDTVSTSITINMNGYNGIRFVERAILTGTASIGITGNALANHITGNNGNNQLDGGEGADTLLGGRGNDIYIVDNIGDSISEAGGDGVDVVRSSVDWTLDLPFENLELTGSANLNGTGSALANRLTGNSGNNILDGGGGTDTLIGGAGDDTYIFDSSGDRAVETVTATVTDTNDAGGIDQIFSSFAVNLNQSNGMRFIENVTLTGTAAASVFGNDLGNAITANSGANFLDGANGDDVILGMTGNDTMLGGAGADSLDGGAGRDRLTGGAGQDILTGGSEADTFVFASGDMGTSQATADRITDWSGLAGGQGDRIDLAAIDANAANGAGTNEVFAFIGSAAFSNVAGQLRSEVISGDTYLMADTNGDGVADLWLRLDGTVTVGAGDLAL